MTTISGVGGPQLSTIPGLPPGAGLDGETILLYCTSQLTNLNGEIKAQMLKQRTMQDAKAKINELLAKFASTQGNHTLSREEKEQILRTYAQAIKEMAPGQGREELLASLHEFRRVAVYNDDGNANAFKGPFDIDGYIATGIEEDLNVPDDGKQSINPGELEGVNKGLKAAAESLNKDAELDMIGLQQLISQRQMAIQITTNLMSKYNQGLEQIAQNLK